MAVPLPPTDSHADRRRHWLTLVYGHGFQAPRPAEAIRMLEDDPDLVGDDPWMACAVGDDGLLLEAVAHDSAWANRPSGLLSMPPLVAVTHSGLIRDPEFTDALVRSAELLLSHGADPCQTWENPAFPDTRESALYGAAGKHHHAEMTRLLLAHGADPNDNESLYHSLESADLTCTRLLLDAGARVAGTNALAHALDFDRIDVVQLLLDAGADPNERHSSALHHAIRRGRTRPFIERLLHAGADIHAINADGQTPYMSALLLGLTDVAELLRSPEEDRALSETQRQPQLSRHSDERGS